MLHGERLRTLRLANKYTQNYLAQILGLNIRQIPRYEAGEVDPSGEVVARMADIFNVSTDYLLGRTDDPTPCAESENLTPKERAVLAALRRGEPLAAIKVIVEEE